MDPTSVRPQSSALSQRPTIQLTNQIVQNVTNDSSEELNAHNSALQRAIQTQVEQAEKIEAKNLAVQMCDIGYSVKLAEIEAQSNKGYSLLEQQIGRAEITTSLADIDRACLTERMSIVENDIIDLDVDLKECLEKMTLKEDVEMYDARIGNLENWRTDNTNTVADLERRQSETDHAFHGLQDTLRQNHSRVVELWQGQAHHTESITELRNWQTGASDTMADLGILQFQHDSQMNDFRQNQEFCNASIADLHERYTDARADIEMLDVQQVQIAQGMEYLSNRQDQSVADLDHLRELQGQNFQDTILGIQAFSQQLRQLNTMLVNVSEASDTRVDQARQEAINQFAEYSSRLQDHDRSLLAMESTLASNEDFHANLWHTLVRSIDDAFREAGARQDADSNRLRNFEAVCDFIAERVDQAMDGSVDTGLSRALQEMQAQVQRIVDVQPRPATQTDQSQAAPPPSNPPDQPTTPESPSRQRTPSTTPQATSIVEQPVPQQISLPHDIGRQVQVIISGHGDNVISVSGTGDAHSTLASDQHRICPPSVKRGNRASGNRARKGLKRCNNRLEGERCSELAMLDFGESEESFWLCCVHS
ncbi:MAG: hypothetical protein Q9219_005307 [cf. Caloplaca sp. 3 TL-2023]